VRTLLRTTAGFAHCACVKIVREALRETVRFPVTPAVTGRSVVGQNDGKPWIPERIPGDLVSASDLVRR